VICTDDAADLDAILVKAAKNHYRYGDGRSSTCGPTAAFAARDLRYAPIIAASELVSTVPDRGDAELAALIDAGVNAGYFRSEGRGFVVTFPGHKRARILEYAAGRHERIYFERLDGTVALKDAILLHVAEDDRRNYPVWLGELEITFPNASRPELETAIRQLRATGHLVSESLTRERMKKLPFHIDDVEMTPLPTNEGKRVAARLRSRDDVHTLFQRPNRTLITTVKEVAITEPKTPYVFIGHGRAPDWRELREFIVDRLGLAVLEFNSDPTAGVATKERLEELLNRASFAFIVATAEDHSTDGTIHARENVVHEIGLFQGRLGFRRAIVLLEGGCTEFSNIAGVGQLRFERNSIASTFENVRNLLEERLR
jgi:predicted nucleotide-binding protein